MANEHPRWFARLVQDAIQNDPTIKNAAEPVRFAWNAEESSFLVELNSGEIYRVTVTTKTTEN